MSARFTNPVANYGGGAEGKKLPTGAAGEGANEHKMTLMKFAE